ncbi:hypothetical protein K466DRAFT_588672 [Polyporus arcularius HHB13444]|uniref:Uncharacterized protein n=1 Tax=Polyporus arcularius HHB13444 TaxID=1314778 RepID=A0A5C3P710_9APHY|nr:hypothetical protein K466DRAFT_588672 [Polyporus arcularius HHB13444]
MAIKERSGARRIYFGGAVNYWLDISPASAGWYEVNRISAGVEDDESVPVGGNTTPGGAAAGGAPIGGNTTPGGAVTYGSSGLYDAPGERAQTPVSYGSTRVPKRGPSSVVSSA